MKKNSNDKITVLSTLNEGNMRDVTSINDTKVIKDNTIAQEKVDEILRKYDIETRYRSKLKGVYSNIIKVIAAGMSLFHLSIAGFGTMPIAQQRILHLTFAMTLVFLLYPARKKSPKDRFAMIDIISALAAIVVNLYLFFNTTQIALRAGRLLPIEVIFGAILVVLLLEATRRCLGNGLPIIALIFLAYAYLGPYLPGVLQHKGYSFARIMDQMYTSSEGIFGIPLGVSCTYIFLFILFGAFLNATGLSVLFNSFAISVAGQKPGGPAKVSIFASGLLGMINGSAPANVVTTGAFTIPLMTKIGYSNNFAAAVEAIASTGGQIMPPVMGAAAFIMAEFLGLPYKTIMIAAIIPAVLYYMALWFNVDLRAKRLKLRGLTKDELPDLKEDFRKYGHLVLPIIILLVLIFLNFTPYYAAFYSIVALLVLGILRPATRLNLRSFIDSLVSGARSALGVAIATAVVGIIVGTINLTGLGLQLSGMIIRLTNSQLIPTLILTMFACLVLGMGLPTSAAYIVAGTVVAPVLTTMGVAPLIAHFFVFYFSIISVVTPPVAIASYAAAGMAGANPTKVGWTAISLGLVAFIVPYMFIYTPGLLFQGAYWRILVNFISATIGVFCLAASVQGYWLTKMSAVMRILSIIACFLCIDGGFITDIFGFVMFTLLFFVQKRKSIVSVDVDKCNATH